MVSELNYPLLNFEVVKSAKFFHLFYFVWQPNRLRGLAVSEPTCVCVRRDDGLYPATTREKH